MDAPFSYTKDQTNVLYQALKNTGLKRDAEWPRYLDAITHYVRAARHKADNEAKSPLPYASKAAQRLDGLIKALAITLQEYERLGSVLQLTVDHCLSTAILLDPLLMHSLPNLERPVAERLLSSGRFPLALKVVLQAAKLAAEPVHYAGKPVAVSKDILRMLPPDVAEIVAKSTSQRRSDGLFQVTGAPKNYAIRYAVRALWAIYEDATDKPPKMYPTAHVKEGHDGGFYKFATASLSPAHLVEKKVLSSNILTAYNEFRLWLKQEQPTEKVKIPR
jgi:hypothetical protein